MNYKLFLPKGAKEFGNNVIIENGLSFPRYAFIAVPIVGTKGNTDNDILSELDTNPVYFDTLSNTFTLTKKTRELENKPYKPIQSTSLSTSSNENSLVKFNFDGYINISKLITQVKKQLKQIKEYESRLVVYEQDIGYTTVRSNNQVPFDLQTIGLTDDYTKLDYELSPHLNLKNLLISNFRPQNLQAQNGISTKIIVNNLKNLAANIYEPILNFLIPDARNFEIISAYSEKTYYSPDEEFYMGEAVQLRFPGATYSTVYLYAKEMASMLFYSKLYLEYFLDKDPRITIMLPSIDNPKPAEFGTRFEYNLIHPGRFINIDKAFDDRDDSGPDVAADGSLNARIEMASLNYEKDYIVLQNFIKDALAKNYLQSEEEAIKFAFRADLNISDVVVKNYIIKDKRDRRKTGFQWDEDDSESDDSKSKELNETIKTYLPQLINCPPVSNGSVTGLPDQTIFPMMSASQFRPITDPTMVYNPTTTAGQYGTPQHIRFNNPLLVKTVEGVTNKPEDGYIGDIGGVAVYSNRLGGLCAGIRMMGSTATPGATLQSAVTTTVPVANQLNVIARLTQAIFGVIDPTGSMLGCAQVPTTGTDPNMMIVMLATMMAAMTQRKTSPMTYDEIKLAQEHVNGANTVLTRNPDGNKKDVIRDPATEQPNVITKTDQDAASLPKDIMDPTINSVQKIIIEGKGVELETKSERKESQETTYIKYDSGTDHTDKPEERGYPGATITPENTEEIMV